MEHGLQKPAQQVTWRGEGVNGWQMGLPHFRDIYDAGFEVPGPG